jgi:hypothetical protein
LTIAAVIVESVIGSGGRSAIWSGWILPISVMFFASTRAFGGLEAVLAYLSRYT